MKKLIIPEDYSSTLDPMATERAIKMIKDQFQTMISSELKLKRITAPMIVLRGTGINDDLNGIERPVSFQAPDLNNQQVEIVHSLAKWKRLMLAKLQLPIGEGIYTDMNALRPDEELSNIHSIYVDQWDWEKTIDEESRNLAFLRDTVESIYGCIKRISFMVCESYSTISLDLPEKITFIQSEDLLRDYPGLSPKERENEAAKKFGAIFIMGIGGKLSSGEAHDGRAPDYDDWTTQNEDGFKGLNGDIILWNPVLKCAFEISSMGIRVDRKAMLEQLSIAGEEARKELYWHKKLLNGELPFSIGGGIGQSRLCMFLLRKAHIGEVQSSIWPDEMVEECEKENIFLF